MVINYGKKYYKGDINNVDPIEIYKMVNNGELKIFPLGFWKNSNSILNAIEITRWLMEEEFGWSEVEVKKIFFFEYV